MEEAIHFEEPGIPRPPKGKTPPRGFWNSYSGMLVSIVMLIIISPFTDRTFTGLIILDLLFGCVILMGFAVVIREKWRIIIGIALIAFVLIVDLSNLKGTSNIKLVVTSALELILLGYFTIVILSNVLNARRVTSNEISGALCVYFLMGVIWALIYYMIEFTWPGSYTSMNHKSLSDDITFEMAMNIFSTLLYFSYTTLTSVGYGDCTPLTIMSRGFSNLEAVLGQLYLALIVSRLVGLYLLNRHQCLREASESASTDESSSAASPVSESASSAPEQREEIRKGHGSLPSLDFFKTPSSTLFVSLLAYMAFCPLLIKEAETPYFFINLMYCAIIISGLRLMTKRRAMFTCFTLLIVTVILIDYHILIGETLALFLPASILRLFILILILVTVVSSLRYREEVTHDHITAAASAYLLFGCLWAEIFLIIELCSPGSFLFSGASWHNYDTLVMMERLKMDLFFFSYTTLTTVGYGDTVPLSHVARLWTYLEAITGVIYLVVLLGYLVAARVSQASEERNRG